MTFQINATFLSNNTETPLFDNITTLFETTTNSSNATTTEAKGQSLKDYDEYWAAIYINKYYLYVITALGLPGNIAALVTLCNMRPLTSSSLYMVVLAIVDTINIVIKISFLQLTYHDVSMGNGGCKFTYFAGTFAMHFSNWILVSMTVERFLAIWFPLKVAELCTLKRAAMTMTVIGFALVGLNFHFLFSTYETWDDYYAWDCQFLSQYADFMKNVWYWIDGAAYSILPFLILIVFNVLIIYGMKRHHRGMSSKIDKTKLTDKMKQQQQITFMLVTVSVVFVVLTMPNCVFFILVNYWNYRESLYETSLYFLLYQIVFVLSDSNHAINFYLYFLSGRKFRQRFFDMICCKKRPIKRPYTTTFSNLNSSTRARNVSMSHNPVPNGVTHNGIQNGRHVENGNNNHQSYVNKAYDSRL